MGGLKPEKDDPQITEDMGHPCLRDRNFSKSAGPCAIHRAIVRLLGDISAQTMCRLHTMAPGQMYLPHQRKNPGDGGSSLKVEKCKMRSLTGVLCKVSGLENLRSGAVLRAVPELTWFSGTLVLSCKPQVPPMQSH